MIPFFARLGGKSKICKKLVKLIPKHTIYVECFVGGGSVFLRKEKVEIEVINDLCQDIVDLWTDLKESGHFVKEYIFSNSRKEFKLHKKNHTNDVKKRLYRNLYLSKFSFGGNRHSHAPNQRTKCTLLKRDVDKYMSRLSDVIILCKDYKQCIQEYDSIHTFFYLDPPYESGQLHSWTYKPLNRSELREVLRGIKGKFLMSYENTCEIREYFKEFNLSTLETFYSTGNRSNTNNKLNELIISNYKKENEHSSIERHTSGKEEG